MRCGAMSGARLMSSGMLYTLVGGGVTLAIELLLFSKLYKALQTGVVSIDIDFVLNMLFFHSDSPNRSNSVIAVERGYAPGIYWFTISVLTFLAMIVGALVVLIAKVGIT
jgi:hypothetical protein